MRYIKPILILIILNISVSAQIDHNVQVVKAYKPSVSDAYKMNILPTIIDTSKIESIFKYQIYPKSVNVNFQLEPIRPAKLQGEPLQKLYSTYIKLGFGNYYTPLAEIHFNTLRSKKQSMGAYYKHLSSFGKLKIRDEKVFAGYSDNSLGVYGKKFLNKRRTLYSDIDLSRNIFYYYGYTPFTYTVISKEKKDIDKQQFLSLAANVGLKNNYNDSSHFNYKTDLGIKHLEDDYGIQENEAKISGIFHNFYNDELLGVSTNLTLFNNKLEKIDFNSGLLNIKPFSSIVGKEWRMEVGLNFTADIYNDSVFYHNYPKVLLQYNVIDNYLIPYLGFDGFLQKNSMRNIVAENKFILPGVYVNNTNYKIILTAGIKGNFTPEITYNFNAKYSVIDNMYFFVNNFDTLSNRFNVLYDDIEMATLQGEIDYKKTEKLNFILKGSYYKYKLSNEEKPWNKPDYITTLITRYNLRDKILLNLGLFAVGNRYTKFYDDSGASKAIKLDMYIDANLGIEYRYSKILSGFINFNNIANTKYNLWYGYPVQRFNFILGITYSL